MTSQFNNYYPIDNYSQNFNLLEKFQSTASNKAVNAVAEQIVNKIPNISKKNAQKKAKTILKATGPLTKKELGPNKINTKDINDIAISAVAENILQAKPKMSVPEAREKAINIIKPTKPRTPTIKPQIFKIAKELVTTVPGTTPKQAVATAMKRLKVPTKKATKSTKKVTTKPGKKVTTKPTRKVGRPHSSHVQFTEKDIQDVTKWQQEKWPNKSPKTNRNFAIYLLETSRHSLGYLKGNDSARKNWARIVARKNKNTSKSTKKVSKSKIKKETLLLGNVQLINGHTYKCISKGNNLYRAENNQLRRYPNEAIAKSWNSDWDSNIKKIDCKVNRIFFGRPMSLSPQVPKKTLPSTKKVYKPHSSHVKFTDKDILDVSSWLKEKHPKSSATSIRNYAIYQLKTSRHSLGYLKGNASARKAWADHLARMKKTTKKPSSIKSTKKPSSIRSTKKPSSIRSTKKPSSGIKYPPGRKVTTKPGKKVTTKPGRKVPTKPVGDKIKVAVRDALVSSKQPVLVKASTKEQAQKIANTIAINK